MKNKRSPQTNVLAALTLALLACSNPVMAATYDPLELKENEFGRLNQNTPENDKADPSTNSFSEPSMLDSLQNSEISNKKTNYLKVLDLLKQKKLADARTTIAELLKTSPKEAEFHNLQGLLESMEKNIPAAQKSYETALQFSSKSILAHLGLAKINLDADKLDKAKEHADKVLALNDKITGAYLVLADVALKKKDNAEVERVLLKAYEKSKGNVTGEIGMLKQIGTFYVIQKQPEKLETLVNDLVKRYPKDSKALSVLAGVQVLTGKKDLAENTLSQIVSQEKQDVNHRLLLVRLLAAKPDKSNEVLKLLDESIAIAPKSPQPLIFKAAYQIKLQKYPEALELAKKIDTTYPTLAIGKILMGDIFLAEKKLDEALENYRKANEIQPNDKVLFTIADLMLAKQQVPEAIKLLDGALVKNPKNGPLHFKLATLYQAQNDFDKAEKHYLAILDGQPDNVLALNNLAWLYSQQNNPKALELGKKAYDKAPNAAAIADTYGYILVKQKQAAEGLKVLEKAAKDAPNENDIQYHLAEAYAETGDSAKATAILETITKAPNEFAEKKAAVALLEKLKAH
jgi:putative PEP-CTERM system TPR-repeat lipoprotein